MNDIRMSVEIPGAFGADVDLRFDNDILIKQTWGITTDEAIALRDALLAKYPVERWEPVSEEYTDVWRCQVKPIDNQLQIHNEVTGDWEAVELPPTIRLCRLVEGA
jgi:hypothetical protein